MKYSIFTGYIFTGYIKQHISLLGLAVKSRFIGLSFVYFCLYEYHSWYIGSRECHSWYIGSYECHFLYIGSYECSWYFKFTWISFLRCTFTWNQALYWFLQKPWLAVWFTFDISSYEGEYHFCLFGSCRYIDICECVLLKIIPFFFFSVITDRVSEICIWGVKFLSFKLLQQSSGTV